MNNSKQQTDERQQGGAVAETGKKETFPVSTPPAFSGDHSSEEGVVGTNRTRDQEATSSMKKLYSVESEVNGVKDEGYVLDRVKVRDRKKGPGPFDHLFNCLKGKGTLRDQGWILTPDGYVREEDLPVREEEEDEAQ